mgnify:CR=1 FL=1
METKLRGQVSFPTIRKRIPIKTELLFFRFCQPFEQQGYKKTNNCTNTSQNYCPEDIN